MALVDVTNTPPALDFVPAAEDVDTIKRLIHDECFRCTGPYISSSANAMCACGAVPRCVLRVKDVKKLLHDAALAGDDAAVRAYHNLCHGGPSIKRIQLAIETAIGEVMFRSGKVKGFNSAQASLWFGYKLKPEPATTELAAPLITSLLAGTDATSALGCAAIASVTRVVAQFDAAATLVQKAVRRSRFRRVVAQAVAADAARKRAAAKLLQKAARRLRFRRVVTLATADAARKLAAATLLQKAARRLRFRRVVTLAVATHGWQEVGARRGRSARASVGGSMVTPLRQPKMSSATRTRGQHANFSALRSLSGFSVQSGVSSTATSRSGAFALARGGTPRRNSARSGRSSGQSSLAWDSTPRDSTPRDSPVQEPVAIEPAPGSLGAQAAHLRQLTGSLKVGCSIQSDKMPVILTEAANQLGINIKGKTWLHVALLAASECYGQITNTPVKQRPRFETAEEAKRHLDQAIATRHVRTAPA